jgi:hypothetical protein
MIEVTIGEAMKTFTSRSSVDESWINQQFEARRRDSGRDPCVRVHVRLSGIETCCWRAVPAVEAAPVGPRIPTKRRCLRSGTKWGCRTRRSRAAAWSRS